MFRETLVVILLGCSLSQAVEVNQETDVVIQRSIVSKSVTALREKVKETIKATIEIPAKGFQKINEKLVNARKHLLEYAKTKLENIKAKYDKLKKAQKEAFYKMLKYVAKAITKKIADKTAEEVQEVKGRIIQAGKNILQKMEKKVHEAVGKPFDKVKENLNQWKNKVNDFWNNNVNGGKKVVGEVSEKINEKVNDAKEKIDGVVDKIWKIFEKKKKQEI